MTIPKINVSVEGIKIIALLAMTMDHVDRIFGATGLFKDTIGRWAFPIFSFLLVQSFILYHPVKKYIVRLACFGVLTSLLMIPFHVGSGHNILYTFLLGIIYIQSCEWVGARVHDPVWQFYWLFLWLLILMPLILVVDYSVFGFLFLLAIYAYYKKQTWINYTAVLLAGTAINCYGVIPALSSLFVCWAFLSVFKLEYHKRVLSWWFFYIYYPLHLFLIRWAYLILTT